MIPFDKKTLQVFSFLFFGFVASLGIAQTGDVPPPPRLVKSNWAGAFVVPNRGSFCVIYDDKVVLEEKTGNDVKTYSKAFIPSSDFAYLIEKAKQGTVPDIGVVPGTVEHTVYGLADQKFSTPERVQMGLVLKEIAGDQIAQNNSEATDSLVALLDSECSKVK